MDGLLLLMGAPPVAPTTYEFVPKLGIFHSRQEFPVAANEYSVLNELEQPLQTDVLVQAQKQVHMTEQDLQFLAVSLMLMLNWLARGCKSTFRRSVGH